MHLSKLDQQLLKSAVSEKRSAVELSRAVKGVITPEQALLRLKELLDASNPLSEAEERRLLILDARRVMGILNEFVEAGDMQAIGEYRRFLKDVGERLDKAQVNVDAISTKLTNAYAQIMSSAISAAFERMPEALLQRGVSVDMIEIEGVFQEVLPAVVSRLEGHTEE